MEIDFIIETLLNPTKFNKITILQLIERISLKLHQTDQTQ